MNEGQVWEALLFASHHNLDNYTAILDNNGFQSDDRNEKILNLQPLSDKIRAFNWHTIEIDGHNLNEILDAFKQAKEARHRPTFIIAHTVKGKGVSFMENNPKWHGSLGINDSEYAKAIKELQDAT